MNKIFKVVWSKTKECYVVVSEVAKNNSGKKKVLASVLAALAVVGAGAAGTPVQAVFSDSGSSINVYPNAKTGNYVGSNAVVVGFENRTDADIAGTDQLGRVIYGTGNIGAGNSALAVGNNNEARGTAVVAIGHGANAKAKQSVALGNVARAEKDGTVAIGTYVNAETTNVGTATVPKYNTKETGVYSTAVGAFSWSKGDYSTAYGYKAEATGGSAVALGRDSAASGSGSVAVGYTNKAKQNVAVALGTNNNVDGEEATAVGSSNTIATNANQATAIGRKNIVNRAGAFAAGFSNVTNGERNVAVGSENTTTGEESIGIGTKVIAGTGKTIAIGGVYNPGGGVEKQTIARGDDTINPATGQVNNVFALAIGNGAQADGKDNKASGMIAIGQDVLANNTNAMALGIQAKATGRSSMAFGQAANAAGSGAFALGQSANATSHGSIAMGNGAQSTGSGSTALGRTAKALNDGTVALGFSAEATGDGAIAIGGDGKGAPFDATNTTFAGLGEKTTATAKNAVAVGHQATANIEGGVALGSESKTTKDAGETGYNPAAGRTNKYDNLTNNTKAALTSTRAAVSIGDDSASVTRQLTGLAAGTQDTDAVNVAQLKAVNLKYAGDSTQVTGSTDVRLNDGTFNVNGDGTLISTEATATGIKVKAKVGGTINNTDGKSVKPTTNGIATTDNVADAINDSYWKATAGGNTDGTPAVGKVKPGTQVTYSAGDNLKVKQTINNTTGDQEYKYSLNPVLTGITSIANTATGPKMTFGGNSINITGGSLDMGNNKITNLATGTDDKDAVNVKQLKDTEIHITPGTYTPDSNKKVTLTYENADNKTVTGKTAVIDLSGLATGGTTSTEKVQKAADATGDKNIAEVGPKSGDTFGAANATYEVAVSRNAVKDAAREAVTVNNGGTTTGGTYTADTNNPISVTAVPDNTNHNTTYAVTFDGNKAAKQIPLTYKATNGTITTADQTVKLDKGLNFTGGDYTTASVGADGKVTFDVTLGTAPTVTDGKPGVPGQAGAAGKDGIATVKTVVDTINNSGWKANAKANGGTLVGNSTATVVKPGDQVNFAAGKNLTVKQDLTGEHTYTYSLNKDVDLTNAGSLTVGDTKVNNDGITIKAPTTPGTTTTDVKLTNTGLDNGGNKIVNVAEGKADTDAVNVKQLKDAKTKLVAGENTTVEGDGTTATPYKVNVKGDLANISSITNGAGSGKISFGNDQVVTVNGDHPISLNGKTGDITGLTNTTIPTAAGSDFATKGRAATEEQLKVVNDKFNNKINLGADTNETTKFQLDNASGIKFNIKGDGSGTGGVNQYISTTANGSNVNVDLTADAKAKLNKTYTVSSGSTNVTVTPTTTGDNTDFKITVASTGTTTSSSWNLATDKVSATEGTVAAGSAATQNIADTKTVTMQAGKNLTVKQTNDGAGNASVAYSLDKDISVENITVTGQNGKDGSIGINGKDGVTRNITVEVPGQAGQPGTPGVDGTTTTRIVFDGKAQANLDDGLKFTGNNESTENKHKLNTLVKVQGEGTKEGTDAAGAKEIQTSDGTKFESAKDNIAVEANGADTLTVKLNKNLKGLDSVTTKEIKLGDANDNISIKKDGDRITYTTNNGGTTTTNKVANLGDELHITPGTYEIGATNKDAAAKNDEVTLTYTDGNGVEKANTFAKIKGVAKSDLSNISNDGKKVITGLGSVVKAGDNVTVKTDTDATTGQKTYTVNAVTPAVYTKADGTKVIKRPDGTFTTNLDGSAGNDVPASDVIVSFQDAAGDTKLGNSIVNNVGSAIDKPGTATGNTFLTQLDNAAANTPFAAVNVRDLKTTADALKANERHIAPTTVATGSTETKGGTANAAGTANVYKYDATSKTVTLTYNDGKGNAVTDTKAVIDFSALNTGGTGASSWNIASDKVSATEGAVAAGSAGTQNIADGKTVTMKAGKNLTVNQSNDGAGNASVAFSLDKNLENLDKVVVNGNDGATGQAGVSIVGPKGANGVDGNDGKVGIAGKDGKDAVSISGKDGVGHIGLQGPKGTPGTPGADGANLDITTDHGTQTLVKPERNNNNQSERIVYVPKDANGNPLKDTDGNDIKREVATMDDGLKFTGNNESTENKQKLGSLVKVQGEGTKESTAVDPATGKKYVVLSDGTTKFESAKDNIAVEADGTDTLTVKLNKNLKGLNSIQLGGNTIQSNGDNITFTTDGGTTKTVATTDQLWTIQANGTDVPAKSGKVNLVAGDHITITPDAANGKMTISATGFGSMDGFNVKTSAESATVGTHAGDTTENIKNGKTVDMQAGKNLVVTQSNDGNGNTTVNYALNKDVNLGNDGSLKTGDTTINNDGFKNGNTTVGGNGMTIKNPTDPTKTVSLTKDGLNNGGNQITNVASGGNVDTNAANIGDIKRLAKDTRIKDGTYTVDNNGTVELTYVDGAGNQVKDASGNAITAKITGLTTLDSTRVNVAVNETGSGKAVGSKAAVKVTKGTEFVAGDNLIVERKANAGTDVDNSVVYSLNKDLKGIETIKNGNTTITLHNNPTTATDPTAVTITGGNINMGGNRIVNVAPAKAGTDAVNLDQLKAARTHVTSKDGTVTVTPTEDKTTGQMTYDLHVTPGQSPDLTRITNKVDQLGEEIGRVGAQGAALSALKPIQYDPLEPTQIMAGYGNYRGNSAVALGVAHYKNESTLIHGGVSWAGGSSHMMANAGVTWKVGNRDSEAAVADRYRKGPISSAYAMQQEMAAMKAQNAGLKGEVSDLKAENEQMKAQIAAMMAKLGL